MPVFVAAAVKAYMINAIQLPINPSPALYQVPVAQPPANTIPIPNINEPIIVPTIGNVLSGIANNPKLVKITRPTLCTVIATSSA